ncbi:response regulator [Limobrevibacterium gyesilva]|nr:response regulator [Limobrevibacterium gyesilva]
MSSRQAHVEGRNRSMADHEHVPRILVAEDDALLAATVDDILRQEGFCVSLTKDGQAALEAAAGTHFDALLTDLRMPRLDGKTLIRLLRAGQPSLPVVVMTGHAPADWLVSLQHEGEGPLIVIDKPMSVRALLYAIRKVLGEPSRRR